MSTPRSRWIFWTNDDPDKHDAESANFWPMQVVSIVVIGVLLTVLMPWWVGTPVIVCALVAPIHLAMHFVTSRPGVFRKAPRLVSTIENLTNLALMVSYGALASRPNPLLWLFPAAFVVLVGLNGRPAIVFALAAAVLPALGTLLRLLADGAMIDSAALVAPFGAGAVLTSTYVFVGFIRLGWAVDAEQRRVSEEARVVEAERQRIARELHDDVGATLAEINLWLGIAQRGSNPEALATARERAGACSVRLREMLVPLREGSSTIVAVVEAVEMRLVGLAEAGDLQVTITIEPGVDRRASLDGVIAHSVQMFVLEAASNAIRHGNARHFDVVISVVDGAVVVAATDDGTGFDVERTLKSGRLLGLQSRATACGARFSGESIAGETTVALTLPAR